MDVSTVLTVAAELVAVAAAGVVIIKLALRERVARRSEVYVPIVRRRRIR